MYAIGTIKAWSLTRRSNCAKEVNHSLHAVLTVLSLGLWLPVWTIAAIRNNNPKKLAVRSTLVDLRKIERLEISPEYRSQLARM